MSILSPHRFSVDDYHRMIEAGILGKGDRVELIHGEIIEMSPTGPKHASAQKRLIAWLRRDQTDRFIFDVQDPVTMPDSEPEPDIVLLRPRQDFYADGHPSPDDVLLVIEIADASLGTDRKVKRPLYAAAGIGEYWIVNVIDESITVHRSPEGDDYTDVHRYAADDTVAPAAFADLTLKVATLFPG